MATPKTDQDNLLLYSLLSFRSIIESLLAAAKPRAVCEVGVDKGLFTEFLTEYCLSNGCNYTGIDPTVNEELAARYGSDTIVFLKKRSINALESLEKHCVYFIDGDHNYFTVKNELCLIVRHHDHWPLIFLHDVGWPWGRRDQYCDPEAIPPAYRHPCSARFGVVPGKSDLQEDGFRGEESDYGYAAADHEGGPRNGVLAAVEDFVEEQGRGNWELIVVPAVFGLGILYSPPHCRRPLLKCIQDLARSVSLLGRFITLLEENRIHLFLTYLKQTKELDVLHARYAELQEAYRSFEKAYQDLSDQFNRLHDDYAALNGNYRDLHDSYEALRKHSDSLQSVYNELLEYTKWLQAESGVKQASP